MPVKKGYKQTAEHIANRILRGPAHAQWKGDAVIKKTGQKRCRALFKNVGPCIRCGAEKVERHHIDGCTTNNDPKNIEILCRRCHMIADGRIEGWRARRAKKIEAML